MKSTRRDLAGRTLGDFVVVGQLDEGGQGVVYRAEQPALGREAVIKVMQAKRKTRSDAVQRFLREARLASKLDHPYAAHVYAFGAEPDGLLWIAMEMVRGTPLDRVLAAQGPLPLERLVPFFERLCEVVHTAHEQGIIHRDLKPANVMVVARAGRLLPKLLDLGIAKMTDAATSEDLSATGEFKVNPETTSDQGLTQRGAVVGSPLYMAPEQWVDPAAADARTDIYALGLLAYEALTRRRPFGGASAAALARAHAQQPVPPLGDGFPPALDEVLGRAMAKQPGDRPASALDLAVALRAASGLEAEREAVPRLDEDTRTEVLTDAPQPIADAVAALDGARHAHQARDAIWEIVSVLCHYLGILAMACRSRLAERPDSELLRTLTRRGLGDADWLALARQLCRPWAAERDAFPLPELVGFLENDAAELEALAAEERAGQFSEEQLHPILVRQLAAVGRTLRALAFLADYPLVTVRGGAGDAWMGTRRAGVRAFPVAAGVPDGQAALVDPSGRPVLLLHPLAQVHAPTPGAPAELFFFAGKGRRGARLVAPPRGFERTDDELWAWYREHLFAAPDDAAAGEAASAPYRGLLPFARGDAAAFFGREAETEAFANRLRVTPLCAVAGPSGAGKSSFVEAGVIPSLGDGWRVLSLRPGAAPMAAFTSLVGDGDTLRAEARARGGQTLVVVDQAEELFTLCLDPGERERFARALVDCARTASDPVRVVLTVRDDFLIRATELPAFRERLGPGLQLLGTPARADLLRIVSLPAERAGYRFEEPDLPARMVDAVAGQPGALALLSFTAARLWELRDRHFRVLPRKAYEQIGGVAGALAQHAEAVRDALPAAEQRLLREAFRALVTAEGTRAVLGRAELVEILGGGPAASRTVDHLVDARLLVTRETEAGTSVEVIHETLLAAWPRLVEWRRQDAEGARLRDQLRAAARQWDERGRVRGLLWRDDALVEYERWRARWSGQLTSVEAAFGEASQADARRSRRNRRLLLGGIFAGLSIALAVALFLRAQATDAQAEADQARRRTEADLTKLLQDQGRRLLLDDDVLHAYPYLAAAHDRAGPSPAILYLLGRAARMLAQQVAVLPHEAGLVWDVQFTPDGERILSTGADRRVRVWDRAGRPLFVFAGHREPVVAVAPSPDGREALSSDLSGRVLQWRIDTGEIVAELPGRPGLLALAWSRDGTRAASATSGGFILLWDPRAHQPVAWMLGHAGVVRALHFVDGDGLLSASLDGRVQLWHGQTGRFRETLMAGGAPIWSLTLSPDGRFATALARDGLVTQLALATRARRQVRGQGAWWAGSRPNGEIITAGEDGSLLVWDQGAVPQAIPLPMHAGTVLHGTLSADGARMVTSSQDGTAVLWELGRRRPIVRLSGHSSAIRRAVFDPKAELVVTAGLDGTARLWRPAPIDLVREESAGHQTALRTMAATADGRLLATLTQSSDLAVHASETFAEVARARLGLDAFALAWSPDGTRVIAVGPGRGEVRRLPGLEVEVTLALERDVGTAAFLDDGHVVVGHDDGRLRLVDLARPTEAVAWEREGATILSLASGGGRVAAGTRDGVLSLRTANGSRVASWPVGAQVIELTVDERHGLLLAGARDNALHVFKLAGGDEFRALAGHGDGVTGAVVLDSGLIGSSSDDGTVRVWDLQSGTHLASMPGAGGKVLGLARVGNRLVGATTSGALSAWRADVLKDFDTIREKLECLVPFALVESERLERKSTPPCDVSGLSAVHIK